jgi:hypothetical protein
MKTVLFDPRTFISPPFIRCPKCGKDSFGVLMIHDNNYWRRCRDCLYPNPTDSPAIYPLPKLNKKVIYIDQFVISNMMKALNPKTKTHSKTVLDTFWLKLFERLDSLCKLQLIICPSSGFHTNESLLSPYFQSLKQMYELLSHGVSFYDHETIKRFQICEHATNWIHGEGEKQLNLNSQSVVHGKINAWQDRLIFSFNLNYGPREIDDLRNARKATHRGLSEVFKRWQSEKNRTFNDWFVEESMAFGRVTLRVYLDYLKRFAQISTGLAKLTVNDIFPPPSVDLIHAIQGAFRNFSIQDSDIWPKTVEYFSSFSLKDVPFIKIYSMMYAALARKAATGRKKPPNQGMVNDIAFISVLLPYCDAILIDNECHAYLKEKPFCDEISYGTLVFSHNSRDDFLKYLNEIEINAPKEHIDKVEEVYGENWREPYITLYKKKNR